MTKEICVGFKLATVSKSCTILKSIKKSIFVVKTVLLFGAVVVVSFDLSKWRFCSGMFPLQFSRDSWRISSQQIRRSSDVRTVLRQIAWSPSRRSTNRIPRTFRHHLAEISFRQTHLKFDSNAWVKKVVQVYNLTSILYNQLNATSYWHSFYNLKTPNHCSEGSINNITALWGPGPGLCDS